MSSTKIVLLVLVLIGALFALGVIKGAAGKDEEDPDPHATKPAWTRTMGKLLSGLGPPGPKVPLEKIGVADGVRTGPKLVIQAGKPCVLTIPPDPDTDFRTLTLKLEEGVPVHVKMPVAGEEESTKEPLKRGDRPLLISIEKGKSARITLTAVGLSGSARIALE